MNNPFLFIAQNALNTLDKLEPAKRAEALSLVIASATTKGGEAIRRRAQALTLALPFDRAEVEALDNSAAYMELEAAKAIGFAVLRNGNVAQISRKVEDARVVFEVQCVLLEKQDWKN